MQTKFSVISNKILKYFIIFSIAFMWINYYYDNTVIVAIISTLIAIIIGQIIALIFKKKSNIIKLSQKEQTHINNISTQFLLAENSKILIFYKNLLSAKRNVAISKNKDAIIWQDTAFLPIYNKYLVTQDDISTAYKNYHDHQNIIIAGIGFSDDAIALSTKITDCKISTLDIQEMYNIYKKYDYYPDFNIKLATKQRANLKKVKETVFIKSNAKHYFLSGLVILITSFFIKYSTYYLVFATLLFVFSAISYFKPFKTLPSIADEL